MRRKLPLSGPLRRPTNPGSMLDAESSDSLRGRQGVPAQVGTAPPPHIFSQVHILISFESSNSASAHPKEVRGATCVSAHSMRVTLNLRRVRHEKHRPKSAPRNGCRAKGRGATFKPRRSHELGRMLVWHGKCALYPLPPTFFINVVIPQELFCMLGKRYHSKVLSWNPGKGTIRRDGKHDRKTTWPCAKFEHVLFYRTSKEEQRLLTGKNMVEKTRNSVEERMDNCDRYFRSV